jgi:hypothetical protein
MNPDLLSRLAQQHIAERHESAAKATAVPAPAASRPTIRNRTGWTLVQLGLRLAVTSTDHA